MPVAAAKYRPQRLRRAPGAAPAGVAPGVPDRPVGSSEGVAEAPREDARRDHVGAAEGREEVVEPLLVEGIEDVELRLEREAVLLQPRSQREVPDGAGLDADG